ncbi:trace amine-associated receptor 1-like [Megalops cyprinoides]|uniref:trace amine-associated receptor 1-like n=1 Tax=Megalops cyprinoides TaxID=118141 RepID=UPI0018641D77|nr:trace amine-associated receptor 1-like [Megalops cyprinoides]
MDSIMNLSQTGRAEYFCYETENRSCPRFIYPTAIRAPLYAFFGFAIVLTVCGNLLVIIAIAHFKQLHTPTNYLILSLAVADLLLGGIIMPGSMVRTVETCWYFGDLFCKIHAGTGVTLCTASILNLSFISIDRYYAVCQPLHYHTKITTGVAVTMVLVSWIVSASVGFAMVFLELNILGIEDFYYNYIACVGGCVLFQSAASSSISSILSFYIPGFIMVGIYQKIFRVAQEQARSINSIACQNVNFEKNKKTVSNSERKATKTLAIVMGVFLSCWTPFFACNVIDPYLNYSIPPVFLDTLVWIGYLNSAFNPIVYAFFYSWFRKALKMIIFGKIFQSDSSRAKLCTD